MHPAEAQHGIIAVQKRTKYAWMTKKHHDDTVQGSSTCAFTIRIYERNLEMATKSGEEPDIQTGHSSIRGTLDNSP